MTDTPHERHHIIQTLQACPSEWYAWDADGNWYYLRYRFGRGTVQVCAGGPAPGSHHDDYVGALFHARTIAEFHHGEPMQGEITLVEFMALWDAAAALDDPPDHLRNRKAR